MNIEKDFVETYEALIKVDVEEALQLCNEEFEKSKNSYLLVLKAECLMALDDFEGALLEIESAIKNGCKKDNFINSLAGECLFYLESYKESKNVFLEILKDNPLSFFAIAYLTDIDIKLGNYLEGIDRAEKLLMSNTLSLNDTSHILINIGWIKLKYLNKVEEALICFTEAINKDSQNGSAFIGIAEYHLLNKEYIKAVENFEKAIELEEGTIDVYYGIAMAFKGLKKYDDALEYINIVISADSMNDEYKNEKTCIINLRNGEI